MDKLKELEDSKIRTVAVSLTAPQDMSSVYERRGADAGRGDWTARFLASNAIAARMADFPPS